MKTTLIFLMACSAVLIAACSKNPGIGGDASIKGSVHVEHWNTTFTQFISEYPGADIYVYLVFGDDVSYGKRIKTNPDGDYEFKYLYKGDYTVYVYSLDSTFTVPGGSVAIEKKVNITDRKETAVVDTFNIFQ
ncbi:MAG: hypothetical protein K1X63_03840 [Chitinophagales bacterium]|nr:hypothetical protein [Chitinophagales bacterium]